MTRHLWRSMTDAGTADFMNRCVIYTVDEVPHSSDMRHRRRIHRPVSSSHLAMAPTSSAKRTKPSMLSAADDLYGVAPLAYAHFLLHRLLYPGAAARSSNTT